MTRPNRKLSHTYTLSILFALLALSPFSLPAQTKHTPTIDESLSLKSISSPMISPDGRFVACRMNETNWKDNEFVSQLWLFNLASGANFQLTRGTHSTAPGECLPPVRWKFAPLARLKSQSWETNSLSFQFVSFMR